MRASVDMNIIRDLVEANRRDAAESKALLNDDLVDQLDLVRTPELDIEIDRTPDHIRRDANLFALGLPEYRPNRELVAILVAELSEIAVERNPAFAVSPRGQHDIRYVAEAIAAGLQVFITRDQEVIDCLADAALKHQLRILRPAETLVRLDELERIEAYRPASLEATAFELHLLAGGEADILGDLFDGRLGERRSQFLSSVRRLTVEGYDRVAIRDAAGAIQACLVHKPEGGCLLVGLARVAETALAPTLARQLMRTLRLAALATGAACIRIEDQYPSRHIQSAAFEDGYSRDGTHLVGLVIDAVGQPLTIGAAAVEASRQCRAVAPSQVATLTIMAAAEWERYWWPAKVVGTGIKNYLIPIRQEFSVELLGRPAGLFRRPEGLGLSREHVYYRSPVGIRLVAPARILWYMSGTGPAAIEAPGIVAASQLEEIHVGTPEELFDRYRHLGVWRLEQVAGTARAGLAQALRFVGTEVFASTVPATLVRRIVKRAPQAPREISDATFTDLYLRGRGRIQ